VTMEPGPLPGEVTYSLGDWVGNSVDEFGVVWKVRKESGWAGTAPRRTARQPKAGQAGSWPAPSYAGERPITLEGVAQAPNPVERENAKDRLAALAGEPDLVLWVNERHLSRQAHVQLEGDGADITDLTSTAFEFVIDVVAEDPLKYGPEAFAQAAFIGAGAGTGRVWPRAWPRDWGAPLGPPPGSVAVANAGTAPYFPKLLRIPGPTLNPVVTLNETGDSIRFNGMVDAGQWLDIYPAQRRVMLNGVASRRFAVSASGWLAIPVGGGTLSVGADSVGAESIMSVWFWEGAWL
jgi:hypothetical protein